MGRTLSRTSPPCSSRFFASRKRQAAGVRRSGESLASRQTRARSAVDGSASSCPPRSGPEVRSPLPAPPQAITAAFGQMPEIRSTLRTVSIISIQTLAQAAPIVAPLNKDAMKRAATESPCRSGASPKRTCSQEPSPFAAPDAAIPARHLAVRRNTRRARGRHGNAQNRRSRK